MTDSSVSIASQLASFLDLNSLHELSRTCRQIRVNLLQYRSQLIAHALRCRHENDDIRLRLADGLRGARNAWAAYGVNGTRLGTMTSGRVGACARDMVGECRQCGSIVCRNCIVKSPPAKTVKDRHRRLCKICMKCPLESHSHLPDEDEKDNVSTEAFTYQAFARDACTCAEQVWICQPCGHSLRTDDISYVRGWSWRRRYSTQLGGLGTGIGEGIDGVQCGRRTGCLAAQEIEKEIECGASQLEADREEAEKAKLEGRLWSGGGYHLQEIEGLGGVLKKKIRKRERVGKVVKEYEDERQHGNWLSREIEGQNRSWCSWCSRVIPSKKDADLGSQDALVRVVSSSSSHSSIETL